MPKNLESQPLEEPFTGDCLHERIAEALGWTVSQTHSFSYQALRAMLRVDHPKLAHELTVLIQTGQYIIGR